MFSCQSPQALLYWLHECTIYHKSLYIRFLHFPGHFKRWKLGSWRWLKSESIKYTHLIQLVLCCTEQRGMNPSLQVNGKINTALVSALPNFKECRWQFTWFYGHVTYIPSKKQQPGVTTIFHRILFPNTKFQAQSKFW